MAVVIVREMYMKHDFTLSFIDKKDDENKFGISNGRGMVSLSGEKSIISDTYIDVQIRLDCCQVHEKLR